MSNENIHSSQIGLRIRTARKNKGINQTELANLLGKSLRTIQKYESGQVQNLKSSTIKILCELFDARPFDFIFDDLDYEEKPEIQIVNVKTNLLKLFTTLNAAGQQKVIDYASDLHEIPKYRK